MRQADAEVVVIGAGLVGAACALRLAEAGRDVLLLDAHAPGMGASFGNAGHVATEQLFPLANAEVIRSSWRYLLAAESPLRIRMGYLLPILPWLARFVWSARPSGFARGVAALMALQQRSRQDLQDLLALAGIGHLLHLDGYLRVWEGVAGAHEATAQARRMAGYGIRSDVWSGAEVHARAPGLRPQVEGAVFYRDTGHVDDPHAVCAGLVTAFRRRGGQLRQARVVRLQVSGGGVSLQLEAGTALRAHRVVVAAGAWSRPLAASLGYRVPLDTERGYHITLPWRGQGVAGAAPRLPLPVASTERSVIMTAMTPGLRMTGTLEFGGLRLPPDPRRYALLRRQAEALLPGVSTEGAREWMGFRPSLPDHLPVLGPAPRHPGVVFAFGHQHLGLTLCAVTAQVVCDAVLGREPVVDLAPYRATRF